MAQQRLATGAAAGRDDRCRGRPAIGAGWSRSCCAATPSLRCCCASWRW
ncbi:MAG: hypothetical protein MZV49_11980 [Rhodopseudomonas palustris]|nr:hypothetical protein [Rhodopseudomonas palustris]